MQKKAYLVLENGKVFEGYSIGASGSAVGETVFTTGMTGYLETLTDKSYYGQLITQTFPLIGNYGVIPEDLEGKTVSAAGYIIRQLCGEPSNYRSTGGLDAFLKIHNVVGIAGIDTRELTKILREKGTMNGMITDCISAAPQDEIQTYTIRNALRAVSVKKAVHHNPDGILHVVLLDFGYKENIVRELVRRNCRVTVVPFDTPPEAVAALCPAGIMLSNGPGDPADNKGVIANLKELMKTGIPVFGICLGHQLLALSQGFQTGKLKYGHRGGNQPVKEAHTGKVYITSQNHGYYVLAESIEKENARLWFTNVNDGTCEGIEYLRSPAFTVQFHPEGAGGPQDTGFLFDRFIKEMETYAAR